MTTPITLDGSRWRTEDDFYAALLSAIGAPEWHGRNLDALADSLGGGDLNDHQSAFVDHNHGITEHGA